MGRRLVANKKGAVQLALQVAEQERGSGSETAGLANPAQGGAGKSEAQSKLQALRERIRAKEVGHQQQQSLQQQQQVRQQRQAYEEELAAVHRRTLERRSARASTAQAVGPKPQRPVAHRGGLGHELLVGGGPQADEQGMHASSAWSELRGHARGSADWSCASCADCVGDRMPEASARRRRLTYKQPVPGGG